MTNEPIDDDAGASLQPRRRQPAHASRRGRSAAGHAGRAGAIDQARLFINTVEAAVRNDPSRIARALRTGDASRADIAQRLEAEVALLDSTYREYRKRNGDAHMYGLQLSALAVSASILRHHESPGRSFDTWDEFVDRIACEISELRQGLAPRTGDSP